MGFSSLKIEIRAVTNRIWPGSTRRSNKRSVFHEGNSPRFVLFIPPDWPFCWHGYKRWFGSMLKQSSHRILPNLAFEFLLQNTKILNQPLHFLDPQHGFRKKLWTSIHLSLEFYLPTNKRCLCGEFLEMKIWDLQSLLVSPIILYLSPSLGVTEFLADGPDWHLWSWAGVWFSLITCGDACSDTLETQRFASCG